MLVYTTPCLFSLFLISANGSCNVAAAFTFQKSFVGINSKLTKNNHFKERLYTPIAPIETHPPNHKKRYPFPINPTLLYSSSTEVEEEETSSSPTEAELKKQILDLIGNNTENSNDENVKKNLTSLLKSLLNECGGSKKGNEVLYQIGKSVYGIDLKKEEEKETTTKKKEEKESDDPIVSFDYLKTFMVDVFETYGVPTDRAETCAEVLVEADRRGIKSHGLGRLKPIYCDRMDAGILLPSMPIDVVSETETTALLDGNLGIGLYVAPYAMQMAIDKAKKHGVGFVAVKNSTHYGIAGYYATMATDNGCVGFTGTNARPSIAPTYGVEPMLGTNPLCFGIPSDDDFPFVIDCATSINQRGKIERYAREGIDTPRGAVIDNNGIQRTDTEGILRDLVLGKAALTPLGGADPELGGYKGYGWATVVELLSIAFQSGVFGEGISGVDRETGEKRPMPLGHYFLAIDVEALTPLDVFKKNVGEFLRALRGSKKSPLGPGRIWTAGEIEYDEFVKQTDQGGMPVPPSLQSVMKDLRDQRPGLKEKYSKLPFE